MIIPVVPTLNSQDAWMKLFQRDERCCFVGSDDCLVSIQANYLQITLLKGAINSRNTIKYSLGSRKSIDPIWALVKGCNWDLASIIEGLEQLDFNSNVRDNSLLKVHSDLTARKFFSKDKHICSSSRLGLLQPHTHAPEAWDRESLMQLLSCKQFVNFRSAATQGDSLRPASVVTYTPDDLLHLLIRQVNHWRMSETQNELRVFFKDKEVARLTPELSLPKPRLSPFN